MWNMMIIGKGYCFHNFIQKFYGDLTSASLERSMYYVSLMNRYVMCLV